MKDIIHKIETVRNNHTDIATENNLAKDITRSGNSVLRKTVDSQLFASHKFSSLASENLSTDNNHNDSLQLSNITCSALYKSSNTSNTTKVSQKPSVFVRSLKKIKMNDNIIDLDANCLLKPRTIYVVKKTKLKDKNCLQIESKRSISGLKSFTGEETELNSLVDQNIDSKKENNKLKDKLDRSEVELLVNNEMYSLLDAFESSEGVSKIFKFPNENVDDGITEGIVNEKYNSQNDEHVKSGLVDNVDDDDTEGIVNEKNAGQDVEHVKSVLVGSVDDGVTESVVDEEEKSHIGKHVKNVPVDTVQLHQDTHQMVPIHDHVYCFNKKMKRKLNQTNDTGNLLEQTVPKRIKNVQRSRKDHNKNIRESKIPTVINKKKKRKMRIASKKNQDTSAPNFDWNEFFDNDVETIEHYDSPEIEVLEYVFKYERFPGSYYMAKLAKNLQVPWKMINLWFMKRRSEAKKNGTMFPIKEFVNCSYCGPLKEGSESFLEHMTSETHISGLKRVHTLRIKKHIIVSEELSANMSADVESTHRVRLQVEETNDEFVANPIENDIDKNDIYKHISKKCRICGDHFPNAFSLQRHSMTHRKILCELCNLTFEHSTYKKHVTSHLIGNDKEKLNKYCRCKTCDQLDCECHFSDKLINCSINYCKCRTCNKSQLSLQSEDQLQGEMKNENTSLINLKMEYCKCRICDKAKSEWASSTKYSKINSGTRLLLSRYKIPSSDSMDELLKVWTHIKRREDMGETTIILPHTAYTDDSINEQNLGSNCHTLAEKKNYPDLITKEVRCVPQYTPHKQNLISKIGFFEEMTDYLNSSNLSDTNLINIRTPRSPYLQENINGTESCHERKEPVTSNVPNWNSIEIKRSRVSEKVINVNSSIDVCFLCGTGRFTSIQLLMHTKVHCNDQNEFFCKECHFTLMTFRDCIEHKFEHLNICLYVCQFCSTTFSKCHDLIHHLARIHSFSDIDLQSSYYWIGIPETILKSVHNENNSLDKSLLVSENIYDIPISIDGEIENIIISDKNVREEILDTSEIPDNIEDLGEIFETVVLSDML